MTFNIVFHNYSEQIYSFVVCVSVFGPFSPNDPGVFGNILFVQ